jgi:transposase
LITIGIDPHKSSLTAVAHDPAGEQLGSVRLRVTAVTSAELLSWAASWPQRQWAVEGATGLGRGIAQQLAVAGEVTLDVPAKLAARARLLGSGSGRKTDLTDASSVAAVAQHHRRLRQVQAEDQLVVLRLLSERRDDLVSERTRCVNRLHVLLRDLHPGGAQQGISADQAAALLRTIRPVTEPDAKRKAIARDLLADLRRHDQALKALDLELRDAVVASGSTLTEIHGLGVVTAAKILALTGDVRRFPSQDHFASYAGTAPIDVSSGDLQRHRLSRRGNRQLNAAIHIVAVCQARDPGPGRDHYRRKLTEAKTPNEARRSLKRRLSNVIYRRLVADLERASNART